MFRMPRPLIAAVSIVLCLPMIIKVQAQDGPQYDPVNGNAAIHVIIPNVDPVFFEDVTEHGGDVILIGTHSSSIRGSMQQRPTTPAVGVFGDQPGSLRTIRRTTVLMLPSASR